MWFHLNFTVVSIKWILGKWKGIYYQFVFGILFSWQQLFHCLQFESSFKCLLLKKQRGKNYKFQKLHYPLEQDYGQENGDISIFAFPLATVISFCHTVACNFLHLWKSTCQVSLCLYINVVNEIKPSQLKNCLVLGYEKHHRMPWKKM